MIHLIDPRLWVFLFQAILLSSYIPLSYLAYQWVRAPLKQDRVRQELSQLGLTQTQELLQTMAAEYRLRHYIWPLSLVSIETFLFYSITHPYVIELGLWKGVLEEVVDVFGLKETLPWDIVAGRILFWGWLGAFVYSLHLTFRRFLAFDLTPSVYIFTGNRFWLAMSVGAIVSIAVGTFLSALNKDSLSVNLITVYLVAFFIGFFPEQGMHWITIMVKEVLKLQGAMAKETSLAEIEGLSIWHQGRLKQEGIENIQNLAMADLPALVAGTPFTVIQIIDWVDQAILLAHTSDLQFEVLEKVGVMRASEVLTNTKDAEILAELAEATDLKISELKVLSRGIQSALNIKLVARFRWCSSLDMARRKEAATLDLSNTLPPQVQMS